MQVQDPPAGIDADRICPMVVRDVHLAAGRRRPTSHRSPIWHSAGEADNVNHAGSRGRNDWPPHRQAAPDRRDRSGAVRSPLFFREVSFRWSAETSYTCRQSWSVSVRQHFPGRRSSTFRCDGSDDGHVRSRRNSRRRSRSDWGWGGSPTRGYWLALDGER